MASVRARKLRITAPSAALVRRGVLAVEDALRTASFGEGSRVYIVRRFSVGDVAPQRGRAGTAAGIARRFAAARSRAVHGTAPGAAGADVVWFHDEVEPLLLLAKRLLRGGQPHEWFWRLILPAVGRATSSREHLGAVLHALAGVAAAPIAIASAVAESAVSAPGTLLDALEGVAAPPLLAALGIDHPARAPVPHGPAQTAGGALAADSPVPWAGAPSPALGPPGLVGPWPALVVAAARRWGPTDGRVISLAAVALVVQAPGLAANPARLGARALSLVGGLAEPQRPLAPPVARPAPRRPGARPAPPGAAARLRPASDRSSPRRQRRRPGGAAAEDPRFALAEPAAAEEAPAPAHVAAAPSVTPGAAPSSAEPDVAEGASPSPEPTASAPPVAPDVLADDASPPWETPLPTTAGGLFFSIRVLAALDLPAFLDDTPGALESAFAARLLLRICERLRVPADDPTVVVARALAAGADELPAALARALDLWIRRVYRWCRRCVGSSLRALVIRPGQISSSATHIDVLFSLAAADPHIRLAGLDIDPGWIPWLGRVILFHYLDL